MQTTANHAQFRKMSQSMLQLLRNRLVCVIAYSVKLPHIQYWKSYSSKFAHLYSFRLLLCRTRPFSYPLFLSFVCIHRLNMFFLSLEAFGPAAPYEIVIENNKEFVFFHFGLSVSATRSVLHVKMLRKQSCFSTIIIY